MKNIFKSILVLMAAAAVASCNVENVGKTFDLAEATEGASFTQVVASNTSLPASQTSYVLTVGRNNSTAAQTINIESTLPEGVCPSSISFAAGQSAADLVLDLSNVEVGTTCKGAITLLEQPAYTRASINVTLAKAYTWAAYGKCEYTDDIVGSLFGADPVTYEVEVEKTEGFDVYRLVDPYGSVFPYNEPGDYRLGVKWVIDARDPNAVVFDRTKLGVDWGYGEMEAAVLSPGKMVNKVITFPERGLVVYDADGGYYANNNGAFKLDLNL